MERERAIQLVTAAAEEHLCRVLTTVDFNSSFKELGADSLDEVKILMLVEDQLDGKTIERVELDKLRTPNDFVTLLTEKY